MTDPSNVNLLIGHQTQLATVRLLSPLQFLPRLFDNFRISVDGQAEPSSLFAFLRGYDTKHTSPVRSATMTFDLFAKPSHRRRVSATGTRCRTPFHCAIEFRDF